MGGQSGALETELRIEEITGSRGTELLFEAASVFVVPRMGEKVELAGEEFKVVKVEHKLTASPAKHLVVVTVEKPQATIAQ